MAAKTLARLLLLHVGVLVAGTVNTSALAAERYSRPPYYRITASSLHDAGLQLGRLARTRIQGWLATDEMKGIIAFVAGDGAEAFHRMKKDNSEIFPDLVRELEGMAIGAEVPLDSIFCATFINELESLMTNHGGQWPPHRGNDGPRRGDDGHCSDVYAVAEGGAAHGFAHGHNEDWPGPVWQFFYFVSLQPSDDAKGAFEPCAGMVYPGSLVGWAGSWNAHGVYLTQNSLFPTRTLAGGMSSAFMQRSALCGNASASAGLDAIVRAMTAPRAGVPWSGGASINLVSLTERRMMNVEMWEQHASIREVPTTSAANYTHVSAHVLDRVKRPNACPAPSRVPLSPRSALC